MGRRQKLPSGVPNSQALPRWRDGPGSRPHGLRHLADVHEPPTHRKRHLAQACSLTGPPQTCCCPRPPHRSPEAPWRWSAAARGSRPRSSPGSSGPSCTRLSPEPVWPAGRPQSSSVAGQEDRRLSEWRQPLLALGIKVKVQAHSLPSTPLHRLS